MSLINEMIKISGQRGKVKSSVLLHEALSLISKDFPEVHSLTFGWPGILPNYSRSALELMAINDSMVKYQTRDELLALLVEANIKEDRFRELLNILQRYPQFKEIVYDILYQNPHIRLALIKE